MTSGPIQPEAALASCFAMTLPTYNGTPVQPPREPYPAMEYGSRFVYRRNAMNPNIDFLGICQLLKALQTVGFSENEIKKIARRIAVELGANFTLYA